MCENDYIVIKLHFNKTAGGVFLYWIIYGKFRGTINVYL